MTKMHLKQVGTYRDTNNLLSHCDKKASTSTGEPLMHISASELADSNVCLVPAIDLVFEYIINS